MRRISASVPVVAAGVRSIVGVAPVLHFPAAAATSADEQVAKNTKIAVELTKRFKGELPPAYTRKHSLTAAQIEKEVEALLGSAQKMRKEITADQPMDKLTLMERCLRHGLWSYYKEEGSADFESMEKWLCYTDMDTTSLAQLKRQAETKARLTAFKARKEADGKPAQCLPEMNVAQEYSEAVDRELVAEKRHRYDTIAANTTQRDEAKLEELAGQYRKPIQEKRLDDLCALLERFKPVLAREAIMQRITVKHLEGELSIYRYLDWMPEVRDRIELECDNRGFQWHMSQEEKRRSAVRLRTQNELKEIMAKNQAADVNTDSSSSLEAAGGNETRDKLLAEVLALQARLKRTDDDGGKPAETKKAAH